jgi:Fe-S-cluster-containing dehydrogenase component
MSATPHAGPRPKDATRANLSTGHVYELLQAVPFLRALSAEQAGQLVKSSYVRIYDPNKVIVRQGDYGHSMFLLIEGRVRIEAVNDTGQSLVLAQINTPGACIGEVALLGRSRRTATVVAEGTSVLLEVEKTAVERANKQTKGKVFKDLEDATRKRSIVSFLRQHRYFNELSEQAMDYIATHSELKTAERGSIIFDASDKDDSVLLLKTSVAKLVRINRGQSGEPDTESILSYFNAGDVIGLKHHGTRGARLISMGFVELITIARSNFYSLLKNDYPEIYESLQQEEQSRIQNLQQDVATRGKTVAIFVQSLMNEGAQEGQSLLTINLNQCIRCGNCVRACQERHGYARVARRGRKLVRRAKVEQEGSRETILLPASCRHCVNPECMIGCPTGAIHRTASGEVDIHPTCIGCASCANRCPWGNISMIDTPGRKVHDPISSQEVIRNRLASKCNLCHGYGNANCVHNCPTGAILRVEPTQYWEEIASVFRDANRKGIGHTDRVPRSSLAHLLMGTATLFVGGSMTALKAYEHMALGGHSAYSWPMITLGASSLLFMLASAALAGRRRIANLPVQFGTFLTWTRAHFYFGVLSLWGMLLHAGFRLGGTLTSMLALMTGAMLLTGFLGVIYYKWLPRAVTRIEGESQVEEDLLKERDELLSRRKEIQQGLTAPAQKLARALVGAGGGAMARYSASYDPRALENKLRERHKLALGELSTEERATLERLLGDSVRLVDISACAALYRLRRVGLYTHIGVASLLLLLLGVHVLGVLFFWTGW